MKLFEIKKFTRIALLGLAVSIGVTSCGPPPPPRVFGVRQSVWNTLSKSEKKEVIKGYNQRQKINAQNAPLNNVINTTGAAVQQHQTQEAWQKNSIGMPPMPNFNN